MFVFYIIELLAQLESYQRYPNLIDIIRFGSLALEDLLGKCRAASFVWKLSFAILRLGIYDTANCQWHPHPRETWQAPTSTHDMQEKETRCLRKATALTGRSVSRIQKQRVAWACACAA